MNKDADKVTITRVSPEQRQLFSDLLEHYLLELGASPRYAYLDLYWEEPCRFAYFICLEEDIVGFTLVRRIEDNEFEMAEFCISKVWRHRGLGRIACTIVFNMHPGTWRVCSYPGDDSAARFWSNVVPANSRREREENHWVFSFSIDKKCYQYYATNYL